KKINLVPAVDTFLEKLYKLEAEFDDPPALMEASLELLSPNIVGKNANDDKDDELSRERLHELGEELTTYVYYATTILEYFKNSLNEQALMRPSKGGKLDDLAKARQVLGINPNISRSLLDSFRHAHNLPPRVWTV